ncbi:hypothetical protein [Halostreptopolyspora alba]|uniref:hypothetical protein n=1 Tax=Halostreptopolyspora alba TaxID=2487137 RepID=UPI0026A092F3
MDAGSILVPFVVALLWFGPILASGALVFYLLARVRRIRDQLAGIRAGLGPHQSEP